MIEIQGDFWAEYEKGIYNGIVCTICQIVKKNGELVMGAGIAKEFNNRFPSLPQTWGKVVNNWKYPHAIFTLRNTKSDHKTTLEGYQWLCYFIGLPTKYHFAYPADLKLIEDSCVFMKSTVECLGLGKILMTRPGCGLGKLNWQEQVKPRISNLLDDRFYIISK